MKIYIIFSNINLYFILSIYTILSNLNFSKSQNPIKFCNENDIGSLITDCINNKRKGKKIKIKLLIHLKIK
jgi:hypothetical protein